MSRFAIFLFGACLLVACHATRALKPQQKENPLDQILAAQAADFDSVLARPDLYEVQIIYTQIDRDARQVPHFTSYYWNVDSTRYFYPASTVKMPLALLTLERINQLKREGAATLNKNTAYALDSVRAFQQNYSVDPSAPGQKPSLAHDIRKIFAVSDNLAYNHLFEFLGREYINQTLHRKGYTRTGIMHRFNYPGRDNRYSSPITFNDGVNSRAYPEKLDTNNWVNPQRGLQKGTGYQDNQGQLIDGPFDFSSKNWFALTDMEKMLRAVIFPEAVPAENRFDLSPDDYRFIRHYMGIFPWECDYPKYDSVQFSKYPVEYLVFGDPKTPLDGSIRSFNKTGGAYGTLTDVAYIVDFENNTEFILAATILCNSDGIFNDDRYDYASVGIPFLGKLGQAVLAYERSRKRKVTPDLRAFKIRK
ncbi:MAG: serine hydrolase [Lewinellaceae bacterium]|nr:serine hydrolase [Saprospiraceae bacterium]MCB9330040.1 serine hydrolase [Lewinellaceae bacterium]